ncbi:CRISPR-associated protein Cas4 [Hazenella coriacea]|uniref:CRISPR-associated exonuclease Cas4 n=1 Tax=Hazenella coriacea TaxID=1179467 RepID=A0A4V2UUY4_9BACL|nr:CRISPR-associated protein Cas4 [Hazenella coriacea]TCS93597.1 CRISPR-associated Cas4 family exonuclease [Hazenella coriacea]
MVDFELIKTQGTNVHYYYVCQRKLWLFSKQITMEHESDLVLQGKILHEQSYKQKKKEVNIDDLIQIDLIGQEYVGEVKSSSKMEQADRMQLLYYLYYLKNIGVKRSGKIHYVKEKKVEEVELTEEDEQIINNCLQEIQRVISLPLPPKKTKLPYCRSCSYYSFCFVGEIDS